MGPKKRTAILFEILIGLGLISILLTCLFTFVIECAKCDVKLDAAREKIGQRIYLQTRLQSVLTSLTSSDSFFTLKLEKEKDESLMIQFDNGIDPDPTFSGPICGKFHLDGDRLMLTTWATEHEEKSREEILLSGVDRFEFEFLGKKNDSKEKMRTINAELAWRSRWAKTDLAIPSIIRLLVWEKKEKEPVRFAFLLPSSEPFITYRASI